LAVRGRALAAAEGAVVRLVRRRTDADAASVAVLVRGGFVVAGLISSSLSMIYGFLTCGGRVSQSEGLSHVTRRQRANTWAGANAR
jgi:hypothetical protein